MIAALFLSTWLSVQSSGALTAGNDTLPAPSKSSLKLIAEGDQRFFYFNDLQQGTPNRRFANIWGGRVGLLYRDDFKAGIGYYFGHQNLNSSALFTDPSTVRSRRLNYVTAFYEQFLFRRPLWELSVPVEVGWGFSRYAFDQPATEATTLRRGQFMPAGAGLSFSFKLPALRRFRALRWFGVNIVGGYRFVLIEDFPRSNVDYSGFYYSVNPVFFLDRFTDDYKAWRRRRATD